MNGLAALVKQITAYAWLTGFLAGSGVATDTSPQSKAEKRKHDFSDKVILVIVKGTPDWACALEEARLERLGKSTFVVGRCTNPTGEDLVPTGSTIWIPPDEVMRIVEFNNVGQVKEYYRARFAADRPASSAKQSAGPSTPPRGDELDAGDGTFTISTREFQLPVSVDPARKSSIRRVVLYVSTDEGKSWKRASECRVGDRNMYFRAPDDGLYWFAVQTVDGDGIKSPDDESKLVVAQKVRVQTRTVATERPGAGERRVPTMSPAD